MSFAAPELLFALLLVPLAGVGYAVLERRRARRAAAWSKSALLPNIVRRPPGMLRHVTIVLFLIAMACLLVGFARPERILPTETKDPPTIVLAFDVSGSMASKDMTPTRIGAARAIAIQFLKELPSNYRVAVMTFGNQVRLVVPSTLNRARVISKASGGGDAPFGTDGRGRRGQPRGRGGGRRRGAESSRSACLGPVRCCCSRTASRPRPERPRGTRP